MNNILLYETEITLEFLQEFAEGLIGRNLSTKEIKRLSYLFYDDEDFRWKIDFAIQDAIYAATNKKSAWSDWDRHHKNEPLSEIFYCN